MNAKAEPSAPEPSRTEIFARAEKRMRQGKRLVISGFVVAVVGIVGYCLACFSAESNPEFGATYLQQQISFVRPALGVIGLGTLLWLVGSFLYLRGGMDSDPDGPDVFF